ncbi:hypothetical protein [Aureibacter tunicatorum]|uniref:Uncharacterized protein n=1 Tax=Aureibacter tunicatorum TaxID=866807 RepID=A0AAE3XGK6_9BACT|nr:hypothetical protein [Aureibacter tunicatorum]MDR6237231.1 hypothetical protein [Aureibacter tunicatorum]BDD06223.1 hypothetical protein AUTU_37060 [Aureibacter tunicatorum]
MNKNLEAEKAKLKKLTDQYKTGIETDFNILKEETDKGLKKAAVAAGIFAGVMLLSRLFRSSPPKQKKKRAKNSEQVNGEEATSQIVVNEKRAMRDNPIYQVFMTEITLFLLSLAKRKLQEAFFNINFSDKDNDE